ncbi:hypothetical protein B0H16DRAFT_249972 [Mycena metata]|uniref:Uncharacterized protein n=1 Tax=Mycena metata TaxID=1033252 RepID=A0AAD7HV07_9AGAR|nr:hypothetical protein B0H16DRAFT_249972 [Mycena metata]
MSTYMAQRAGSSPSPFPSLPSQTPVPLESPEPDDEWKANKRVEIENDFKPIIQDAKDRLEAGIKALAVDSPDFAARKQELIEAYNVESDSIRNLAKEEFMVRLADERLLRRVTTGGTVNAEVKQSMVDQQAAILAQIQRNNRRDSTAGGSQPDIASTSSSPATRRDSDARPQVSQSSSSPAPQRDLDPRRGAPPPSPSARDRPSSKRPPGKPNHPDPPPMQVRATPAPPSPSPLVTAAEPRYGSPGRNTSSPVHERRTTAPSPLQEGWTAASTPPPAPDGLLADTGAPTTPITHASSSPSSRPVASPTDKRFFDPSSRQASNSPVQERAAPQERSIPVPHPPAMPPPSRTSGSLNRQTSNTMKEATSTPIPMENAYRPASSPLHAKRSQSNFQGPLSNSGTRTVAESWMGSALMEEPEAAPASTFERAMHMPMPSGRSRDPTPEKPIASSPPASRPPPQFWTPPTPDKETPALNFAANRSGSNQRPAQSSPRKPIPASFVPESAPPAPPLVEDEVAKNVALEEARRQESEQQWASLEKTKEKESLGRAAGARLSTASEQIPRQSEHVAALLLLAPRMLLHRRRTLHRPMVPCPHPTALPRRIVLRRRLMAKPHRPPIPLQPHEP